MLPFKVPSIFQDFSEQYPKAHQIQTIAKSGGNTARNSIARLWLSEGIPYAFKESPILYEEIRSWIATRLDIDPKEISMTGSGRIGQSLAPSKLGTDFSEKSDLDLFIISENLLNRLRNDFNSWSFDFESGCVKPSNDREEKFWKDNLSRGHTYFSRGFFDAKLIPNYNKYTCASNIANTMWMLKAKLDVTPNAPKVSEASVRCYKTWADFVRQVSINLA
ncbi:MAG: hypothetical protein M0P43_04550 [Arcobacteraceae bacterium]|nr:hypothetical protein [Arcobacteraceae bacterium]